MKLNKIRLENIRSYLYQEIEFPEGTLLLSGDIGSGKSTVLLAIDFVLFGLQRGTLSGASLLRNGENRGSVELDFEIDDKNIVIKRTLKRENNSVTQDSGYILINDEKKECTAIELKQMVLELLNYPKESLTKSKSLIYRYTVYTPQEEMKQILVGDEEMRLDTLRRVFGVDKYKRVKENTKIFISKTKEKKKELEGRISDLNEKKLEEEKRKKESGEIEKRIKAIVPDLELIKSDILKKKTNIEKTESDMDRLDELKKEVEINDLKLSYLIERKKEDKERLEELDEEIKELRVELKEEVGIKIEEIKKERADKENQIKLFETTIREISNKLNELNVKKDNSMEIKEKISKLNICPLCKQQVTKQHIEHVKEIEDKKIKDFLLGIKESQNQLKKAEHKLDVLERETEELREKEHTYELIKLKISTIKEKNTAKEKLLQSQEVIKKKIGEINAKKTELFKEIDKFKDIEKSYSKIKDELNKSQERERELEIKKAGLDRELENLNELIEMLKNEIKQKLKFKEELQYLAQLQYWLEEHFINLVDTIERTIMLRVHSDFDNLFQKWFNILIDSEILKIKLDNEFTPLIEQNGYDCDYDYLSGGEKTAAALAYRLSLNQVINNLMSTIKTNDLLILDEPTDGFSTEQLDRVKLVLDELDLKQIILVSHETKIEGFVDNVIRFEKKEHVSQVSNNNI